MDLAELKRREKELRERYGDDLYEKLYMKYSAGEEAPAAPAPAYRPAGPSPVKPVEPPAAYEPPVNRPAGSAPKTIEDYRKGIEDLTKRLDSLNKQQYQHMLAGNDNKVNVLDSVIKNTESHKNNLKEQMAHIMGVGSESKDKDMLRSGGASNRVNDPSQHGGIPYAGAPSNGHFDADSSSMSNQPGLDGNNRDETETEPSPEPEYRPAEEKEEPVTLYYPGTKNPNYINKDDYDSIEDYYDAIGERCSGYVSNNDKAGLETFLKENNLYSGPSSVDTIFALEKEKRENEGDKEEIVADNLANADKPPAEKAKELDKTMQPRDDGQGEVQTPTEKLMGDLSHLEDKMREFSRIFGLDKYSDSQLALTEAGKIYLGMLEQKDDLTGQINTSVTAKIDREAYDSDEDYYKALIKQQRFLLFDKEELDEFRKNNGYESRRDNNPFIEDKTFDNWSENLIDIIGEDEYDEFIEQISMPQATMVAPQTSPPKDTENGIVTVKGKDISVITWDPEYGDYSGKVVKHITAHKNEFNWVRFVMPEGTSESDFPDPEPKSDLIKQNKAAADKASGWLLLAETALDVLKAYDQYDVFVDIIDIEGQQKAIIRYEDSAHNYYDLSKDRVNYDPDTDTSITLDKRHEQPGFGYIFVSDRKAMLVPIIYPGDKFIKNGKDITGNMRNPVEISPELAKRIEDMLAEKGYYINLTFDD